MKIYLGWLFHFRHVAQYIDRNNLPFENLKIVYSEYWHSGAVFELYNLQENCEHERVSTLVVNSDSDNYGTNEYVEVKSERLVNLREQIRKKYSIEIIEAVEDGNGNYVVYDENGQVFVSTEFDEIERPYETMPFASVNESRLDILENRIADQTDSLKKMQEVQVSAFIIQRLIERIKGYQLEKERILENIRIATMNKLTPSQIENKTINGDVTVQSFQTAMAGLLTESKSLEKEGEGLDD